MSWALIVGLGILGSPLLGSRLARHRVEAPIRAMLLSPWAPAMLGLITSLLTWWVWGSLSQVAVFHDEAAYRLQAEIFAAGRWNLPSPPWPEFWEQMAVLVTPVLAPKMPPGHALIMVPGVWVGAPGLAAVVLAGVSGGLIFSLVRNATNVWIAFLTWLLWLTAPKAMIWRSAYFSEATTAALWVIGWWSATKWLSGRQVRWLVAVAACVGWGMITRPLTMLVYAIPLGALVILKLREWKSWNQLVPASLVGILLISVIPLWSAKTTGDAFTAPLATYTQQYMPWDVPRFGLDTTPPLRELPADLASVADQFKELHTEHTLKNLPTILRDRVVHIASGMWGGWRWPLLVAAVVGLLACTPMIWFVVVTATLLILSYGSYVHTPDWSVYYYEMAPVLALLSALGISLLVNTLSRALYRPGELRAEEQAVSNTSLAIIALLLIVPSIGDARTAQSRRQRETQFFRLFEQATISLPSEKSIVFVRYGPNHVGHFSLVRNVSDIEKARTWVVYDRGSANTELMRDAPDRVPYLFDGATRSITRLKD